MSNTSINVDLAKAAFVLNMLRDDQATASYVTGCLLHGLALQILHNVGRPHDELMSSAKQTLEHLNDQKVIQSTTR